MSAVLRMGARLERPTGAGPLGGPDAWPQPNPIPRPACERDHVCIGLMSDFSLMLLFVASYPSWVKITVYSP